MATVKYDVEKFDGTKSFALWQVRMYAVLISNGLGDAIDGRDAAMSDADWKKLDKKALAAIQLCLSDATLQEVVGIKTAKGVWDKLAELYLTKSLTNKLRLKLKLYTLRMSEGASLSGHISAFSSTVNDLASVGSKVEDEDQALLLLCSLPASYSNFRDTMIYGRENITFEDVKNNLKAKIHIDSEITTRDSGRSLDDALVMENRGRSNKSKSKSKDVECYYCHKKGHIKRNCPKKKSNMDSKSRDEDNGDDRVTSVDEDFFSLREGDSEDLVSDENTWLVDSGATAHVARSRELFSTYTPGDKGVLRMGNGGVAKVVGIGDIRVETNTGVDLVLSGVRHAPDVRSNTISVQALDGSGYANHFGNGKWRLCKGNLVVATGALMRKLYRTKAFARTSYANVVRKGSSIGHQNVMASKVVRGKACLGKRSHGATKKSRARIVEYRKPEILERVHNGGLKEIQGEGELGGKFSKDSSLVVNVLGRRTDSHGGRDEVVSVKVPVPRRSRRRRQSSLRYDYIYVY